MNDWPGRWPDANRHSGEAVGPHLITSQAWQPTMHQLQTHPAPSSSPPYAIPRHPGIPQHDIHAGSQGGGRQRANARPPLRRRPRRVLPRLVLLLFVLLVLGTVGTYIWANLKVNREVNLDAISDRPPLGRGTNYLIVGSDSRQGLTEQETKYLHTGGSADEGSRTDTMILVHTGAHGTTMMSLPRDSWVTIPPYIDPGTGVHYGASPNKLNAAFSLGGPGLLVRTIENSTGLHIDHYTEIGFGGFTSIVDAVDGVTMCLDKAVKDEKSGENLTKGCHTLDGRTALAFVRQRHQEAQGDLGRTLNQQKFLTALAHKIATPGVMFNPFKVYQVANVGLNTLTVDRHMTLRDLASMFQGLRSITAGDGKRINVPVSDLNFRTSQGSAVRWNWPQASKIFAALQNDQSVNVK
jgi:LCP family protein required for cell wall assembly